MLNKGPHIEEAIGVLDDILRRMQEHQRKKLPMMRRLRWWARPNEHLGYFTVPSAAPQHAIPAEHPASAAAHLSLVDTADEEFEKAL